MLVQIVSLLTVLIVSVQIALADPLLATPQPGLCRA
jgi:hypothetical protein